MKIGGGVRMRGRDRSHGSWVGTKTGMIMYG